MRLEESCADARGHIRSAGVTGPLSAAQTVTLVSAALARRARAPAAAIDVESGGGPARPRAADGAPESTPRFYSPYDRLR